VDPNAGPPRQLTLALNFADSGARGRVNVLGGAGTNYSSADGTFELRNIYADDYVITASTPGKRTPVSLPLSVHGDLEGVLLYLGAGSSLIGHLRVEQKSEVNPTVPLDSIRIRLTNRTNSRNTPEPLRVTADRSFRIDNLRTGDYSLAITGLPEGFFLKEARLGQTDVLNNPLHYTEGEAVPLEVLISQTAGAVEGVALDAAGRPLPDAQVVLIPNGNRNRTDLFRAVSADADGRFTISSIAPGDYTLAAWEILEPYGFFNPELLSQAEQLGKNIHVAESSNQKMTIVGIP